MTAFQLRIRELQGSTGWSLNDMPLGDAEVRAIVAAMHSSPPLLSFAAYGCALAGWPVLMAALPSVTLHTLALQRAAMGLPGIQALAGALGFNSSLVALNVAQNYFGSAGAHALAAALCVNSTLTDLDVTRNVIGDRGAKDFALSLHVNRSLRRLNLSCNGIGPPGALWLAYAMPRTNTLQSLDLAGNRLAPQSVAAMELHTQGNTTLMYLCGMVGGSAVLRKLTSVNRRAFRLAGTQGAAGVPQPAGANPQGLAAAAAAMAVPVTAPITTLTVPAANPTAAPPAVLVAHPPGWIAWSLAAASLVLASFSAPGPTNPSTTHVETERPDQPECAICVEPLFVANRHAAIFPCGHGFHEDCLGTFRLAGGASCPKCRGSIAASVRMFLS